MFYQHDISRDAFMLHVSIDRLKCPLVIGYKALNTRIPAEGIAAV